MADGADSNLQAMLELKAIVDGLGQFVPGEQLEALSPVLRAEGLANPRILAEFDAHLFAADFLMLLLPSSWNLLPSF